MSLALGFRQGDIVMLVDLVLILLHLELPVVVLRPHPGVIVTTEMSAADTKRHRNLSHLSGSSITIES